MGIVVGSCVSVFAKDKTHRLFAAIQGRKLGVLGVIPASLLGIASLFCMYGTIPIAASFAQKGMREDWIAAFCMSSILLNPQLLFYSVALGPNAFIIRFMSCFLCSAAAGLCIRLFYKNKKIIKIVLGLKHFIFYVAFSIVFALISSLSIDYLFKIEV